MKNLTIGILLFVSLALGTLCLRQNRKGDELQATVASLRQNADDLAGRLSQQEQRATALKTRLQDTRAKVVAKAEQALRQAVLYAPVFPVRWRWDAGRALAVPRFSGARKVPPPIQRMRADDLLAALRLVASGLGITFVQASLRDFLADSVIFRELPWFPSRV